jgi:hypothetical protein
MSAEFAGGSVGTSSAQRATSLVPNPGPTLPLNAVSTPGGFPAGGINSPAGTMPVGALPAQAPQGYVNNPGAYAMAVTPVVQPTTALYKGEIPFLNQFSKLRIFLEKGAEVERMGVKIDLRTRISEPLIRTIQYRIQAAKGYDKVGDEWLSWPWQAFYDFFTTGKGSVGKKDPRPKDRIESIPFVSFNPDDLRTTDEIVEAISNIATDYHELFAAADEQADFVQHMMKAIKACSSSNPKLVLLHEKLKEGDPPSDIDKFVERLYTIASEAYEVFVQHSEWMDKANKIKSEDKGAKRPHDHGSKGGNGSSFKRLNTKNDSSDSGGSKSGSAHNSGGKSCHVCGSTFHLQRFCSRRTHPSANLTGVPWHESVNGKLYKKNLKKDWLIPGKKADGTASEWIEPKEKGMAVSLSDSYVCHLQSNLSYRLENRHCIPGTVSNQEGNSTNCYFILDTGAFQDNFITEEMANRLSTIGFHTCLCNKVICSAFSGICRRSKGCVKFSLCFNNSITGEIEQIFISAVIADIIVDLIIGRPTIIQNGLLAKLAHTFTEDSLEAREMRALGTDPTELSSSATSSTITAAAGVGVDAATHMEISQGDLETSTNPAGGVTKSTTLTPLMILSNLHRKPMSAFLDPVQDDDEVETLSSTIDPWDENHLPRSGRENLGSIHVEGGDTLKHRIEELLAEFEDIFSTELRKEPADVPPMELEVDTEKWERQTNSRGPRVVSVAKQFELEKQMRKMIANNVVRPSEAAYYSQILLTPKSDGTWRFCVDFRELNAVCKMIGGYIPNIKEMLQRLGRARPKFFAVLDLTKGYYQAPLSMASMIYTAFITFMGLFQWVRVPMGLKGAPTYFQRIMVTYVLAGLVYLICEVYLDDIIVHANTEDEFIDRLRQVFERLRLRKITLNPSKCRLGMSKTEYVGHVIDETGLSFSEEKKNEVLKCRRPSTQKELKSFLGLVNYFRDHIKDHSSIVQPLNEMIPGGESYKRSASLRWTPETINAFNVIQTAVVNCPKLYFIDTACPITLATDASDYGIGAYLYQTTQSGEEQPLAFISKKLAGAQLNWSTPEKECYAIFYAIKKLEYLIRDVHFTLFTDHKNLTYINDEGSPKVVRWKVAIQEFMFDILYLQGEKNQVADHWSRTVDRPEFTTPEEEDKETTYLMGLIGESFRIPDDLYKRIAAVHNSIVGHMGVSATLDRVYRDGKGELQPLMRSYIRQFIRQCPCCQKMSQLKMPIATHKFITASYSVMERIGVDTVGPLPPDEYGNRYLLVVLDAMSRYLQMYPIKDTTAVQAVKGLIKWTASFGVPLQILSDNGTQFANALVTEFVKHVGCEHVRVMPYSSEENGMVERGNKEALRHIRSTMFDKAIVEDWGWLYPLAERTINSTVNESIGVSPAQIVFGNAIDLDRGLFVPVEPDEQRAETLSKHMDKMLAAQQKFLSIALQTQRKRDEKHMSTQGPVTEFPINSYVLIQYENKEHRPPSKLHTLRKGPMKVVNSVGSRYTVQNLVTFKLEDYHVTNLRPFVYDPTRTDPRLVANADQKVSDIEAIVAHRGQVKRKSSMQFKVRWAGLGEEGDTWEPWSSLRTNHFLFLYLASRKLKTLIPPQFRDQY